MLGPLDIRRWEMSTAVMIIPLSYGQATFTYSGVGVNFPAANTIGFSNVAADDPDTIAVSLVALWETNVLTLLNDDITFDGVLVKLGPNSTGASGLAVSGDPGGSGSPCATPNVTYLVQKNTALGGREGRGRLYLPGVGEDKVGPGGIVDPTTVANINTGMAAVYSGMNGAGWTPVLLHNSTTQPTDITSFTCSPLAATQRRRMRR